jgi:hypothetical protein
MIYLVWRLVEALASYPKLVKLSLPRLCSDIQGFRSLAKYLLRGTLKDLEGRQACTIAEYLKISPFPTLFSPLFYVSFIIVFTKTYLSSDFVEIVSFFISFLSSYFPCHVLVFFFVLVPVFSFF